MYIIPTQIKFAEGASNTCKKKQNIVELICMLKGGLYKLISGTDVRGVAVGNDGEITLTDDAVERISRAFCKWLRNRKNIEAPVIAVGNDSRISAPRILERVKEGLLTSGADVIYTGLSSTPSMFMLLKKRDVDASVMITASHMPSNRNGLKFFTGKGGIERAELEEILSFAEKGERDYGKGNYSFAPFMDEYSSALVKKVETECGYLPLKGKKIIVDAGNGAGGFFAEKVLIPLGADVSGSQFLEPDGTFPNHIPNPEDKEAIKSLSRAVIANKADLGVIFDTDVDRAALVGPDGKEINRNRLIALISAILLKEKAGVIVTDSVTCNSLTDFIESLGGKHLRFKRGYKNVIDKCAELNAEGIYSPLAIETSGHAALKENYLLDDGAYLVVRLLTSFAKQAKEGKTLEDLIKDFREPADEAEVRITFKENVPDFKAAGEEVIQGLKETAAKSEDMYLAPDNYEGVKINFKDGAVLIRMSVHDPVMPINAESDIKGGAKEILKTLCSLLEKYEFLNLENLRKAI